MAEFSGSNEREADALRDELRRQKDAIAQTHARLTAIHTSTAWRFVAAAYAVCRRLLPIGTRRYRVVRKAIRGLAKFVDLTHRPATAVPAANCQPPQSPADVVSPDTAYARWIWLNEPLAGELIAQSRVRMPYSPTVSIVVPTFNTPGEYLTAMLDSVQAQSYPHWELCIADGGSTHQQVAKTLQTAAAADPRIKITLLGRNLGIAGNTNAALALATGDFVALLDHDDTLAPFALFEIAQAINDQPDADVLYSDEDKIDGTGRIRSFPHFKPNWSPDALRSHNYVCHLLVVRRTLVEALGGVRTGFDGGQDHDLALRATEHARKIVHISKVLYHWRAHAASTAQGREAKNYAAAAGARAVAEQLARINYPGEVQPGRVPGTYSIRYELPTRPLVSIIIPNRDQTDTLRRCIASIDRSTYDRYELIIVENGSREPATHELYAELQQRRNAKIVRWEAEFNFAAVNNYAVQHSAGDVLLFLNNDTEALHADWLERLLEHALRPEVGAVGAKLYYPDGTLQHAGVIVGLCGNAAHMHHYYPGDDDGYFGRLAIVQNYSAVTGACLMGRRDVFDSIGGFDEQYVLSYNDVDFCLRLRERGLLVVWTPEAQLRHWESKTRGPDTTPETATRFARESALFQKRWADLLARGDPYYSPHLILSNTTCSVRA